MRHPPEFDARFTELASLAYRNAYRILGSRTEAEEVAQDAMVKALLGWKRISGHADAWVCRVATNGAIGVIRKRRDHQPPPIDLTTELGQVVADRLFLQDLLLSLPRRQRDVLALRYLADLPEAAVAEELGITVGSVKTHAHRALAKLRAHLAGSDGPNRTGSAVAVEQSDQRPDPAAATSPIPPQSQNSQSQKRGTR